MSGFPEKPKPGIEGQTIEKLYLVEFDKILVIFRNSWILPGQPCVKSIGIDSDTSDLVWMKWISIFSFDLKI